MHYLIIFLIILLRNIAGHAKTYDCFPFFNEIELLKMRLEELDPVVDYFVIVEHIETQRGDLKPLYFQENQASFSKYLDKIIHVVVNERHPEMSLWEREHYQRNCIERGLTQCEESDLIIISDVDEIPRLDMIQLCLHTLPDRNRSLFQAGEHEKFPKKSRGRTRKVEKRFYLNGAYALEMPLYFYQLNRQALHKKEWAEGEGEWIGSVITTYAIFKKFNAQHFRDYRWKFPKMYKGGWHFTWMGGREKIRKKMESVVEGQADTTTISDMQIDQLIHEHPIIPIDTSFPKYILNNLPYLKSIGFIAED